MSQLKKSHEIRDHAELGGSSAERWVNCPGSVFLKRTIAEPPTSEAAKEGTEAHEYAEIMLRDFLEAKEDGPKPISKIFNFEDIDSLTAYVSVIWDNILGRSITNKIWGLEDEFEFNPDLKMYGIVDFWCVYINDKGERVGVIVDFKYGFKFVNEKKNAQLAFYACALRNFVRSKGKDLDVIRAAIFQPRVLDQDSYRETKFSAKQLDAWEKKFLKAAHQIYVKKTPKFKIGSWCIYCPAQACCPAYVKNIETSTALKLIDVDEVALPVLPTLSDKEILRIIKMSDKIEDFIKACENYAISRYVHGEPIPGTKVVGSKPRRCWIKDEAAVAKVIESFKVNPYKNKLKALGEAEKECLAVSKNAKTALASVITTGEVKPILTTEDDPRPALQNMMDLLKETSDE